MRRAALLILFVVAMIVGAAYALPVQAAKQTVIVGTVTMLHQDDLDHGTAKMKTGVVVNGVLVPVKGLRDDDLGRLVSVTGQYHGKTFAASEVQILEQPRLSAVNRTRIAVIPLNFTDDRSEGATVAQLTAQYFGPRPSVRDWFETISYGTQHYTGTVFPWVHLNVARGSGCDNGWSAAANALVDRTGYDTTVYMWPRAAGCPFTGAAGLGSAVINAVPGSLSTIIHELGHTNGLEHARSWACTDGAGVAVALSATDNCTFVEYGDPFDVMGSGGLRGMSNWQRAQLGWMTSTTITQSGTYTIAPIQNTTGQRFLRVARGNGDFLNLEFSQSDGFYANYGPDWPVTNGVTIRNAPNPDPSRDWVAFPHLIDTTPDTASWWDAPLAVGKTLTDPKTGVKITTLSVSPAGANVLIDFGVTPPTTTAPATTVPPTTSTSTTTTTTTTTQPPGGAVNFVRQVASGTKSQSGNTTLALTVTAPVATGHRVIAAASVGTFNGAVSCKDSRGNTYTVDAKAPTNNLFVCSANVTTPLVVGDTITLTYPGYSGQSAGIAGDYIASTVDGNRSGASTSTRNVTVNPALATSSTGLLLEVVGSKPTFAAGNGFAVTGVQAGGTLTVGFRTAPAGSYTALGSVTTGAWRALLVAYH